MAKVIMVGNGKGGVGKTDTAKNVSFCLAEQGKMTLMIDLDEQGNSSRVMSGGKYLFDSTMTDIFLKPKAELLDVIISAVDGKTQKEIENLYIAPSSPLLGDALMAAQQRMRREQILEKALKSVIEDFDYIVIDCPPALDLSVMNAAIVADLVVMTIGEVSSVEGAGALYGKIQDLREGGMPICQMVRTRRHARSTTVNRQIEKDMVSSPIPIFKTEINECIGVSKSVLANQAVCAFARNSVVAMKYKDLTKEIVEVLGS